MAKVLKVADFDDDDVGAMWRAVKKAQQDNRADNRASSAEVLTQHGVAFASKNSGAHLIVTHGDKRVDFWPGPGKWHHGKRRGFGVFKLLAYLGVARRDNRNLGPNAPNVIDRIPYVDMGDD